ncbi:hypothetical protein MY7_0039 [Bacillus sp. 5B6]|nr:hypothetical protein MY7_0039 [Bacillus sp. 5B6]
MASCVLFVFFPSIEELFYGDKYARGHYFLHFEICDKAHM